MTDIIIEYQSRGAEKTIRELEQFNAAAGSTADATVSLARSLNLSFKEANRLTKSIGTSSKDLAQATIRFRQLSSIGASTEESFKQLSSEFGINRQQFDLLSKAIQAGDARIKAIGESAGEASGLVGVLSGAFGDLVGVLDTIGGAGLGLDSLTDLFDIVTALPTAIFETAKEFDAAAGTFEFASGSAGEAETNFAFLQEQAGRLRQQLPGLQESFTELALATRGTNIEGEATRQIFENTALATAVYGNSVEGLGGVFLAFQQILSSGRVSLEDFNQITERIPGAINLAAQATGTTTEEFRKLVSEGAIPAAQFVQAFSQVLGEAAREGEFAIPSLEAELTALSGAFTAVRRELGESIIPILTELAVSLQGLVRSTVPAAEALGDLLGGAFRVAADNGELVLALSLALAVQLNRQAIAAAAAAVATNAKAAADLALALATGKANIATARQIVLLRQQVASFAAAATSAGLLAGAFAAIAVNVETFRRIRESSENAREGIEGITSALEDFRRAQIQEQDISNAEELGEVFEENEQKIRDGVGGIQRALDFFRVSIVETVLEGVASIEFLPDAVQDAIRRIVDLIPNLTKAGDAAVNEQRAQFGELVNAADDAISAFERLRDAPGGLAEATEDEVNAARAAIAAASAAIADEDVTTSGQLAAQQTYLDSLEDIQAQLNAVVGAEDDYVQALQDTLAANRDTAAGIVEQGERRVRASDRFAAAALASLEEQLSQQLITQEDFAKRSRDIEQSALNDRLEINRNGIRRISALISGGLEGEQLEEAQEALLALETESADLRAEIARNLTDARIEEEERAREALEEAIRATNDAIALAETERLTEVQRRLNEGVISQRIADEQRLNSTRDRLNAELEASQENVERLRTQIAQGDTGAAAELRQAIQRTANLQIQVLENERAKQEQVADERIRQIQKRSQFEQAASQERIDDLDAEANAIESQEASFARQNALLQAQAALQDSLAGLAEARINTEIQQLNEALSLSQRLEEEEDSRTRNLIRSRLRELGIRGDAEDIQVRTAELEAEAAQQQLQVLQQQQEVERQSLQFQIQSNELAAQRAVTEARIAEIRAQADVSQAQADVQSAQQIVDPEERKAAVAAARAQLDAARQVAELSGEATAEAQLQVENVEQIGDAQLRALDAQQESARVQAEAAASAAEFAEALTRAERASGALASNLSNAGLGVESRRSGGPMKAGKPYLVGDGPGGRITPYSEIVVPGARSQVIANRKAKQILGSYNAPPAVANVGSRSRSPSKSDPLLSEIKGLRRDISRMESGVNIQNARFPTTVTVAQPDDPLALSVHDLQRVRRALFSNSRRPNYRSN